MNESKRTKPYKLTVVDQVQRDQISWFYAQFLRYLMEKYPNVSICGETSATNEYYEDNTKYMHIHYYVTVGMSTCEIHIDEARTLMREDWPFTRLLQFVEHPDRCLQTVVQTYGEVLRSASSGGKEEEA